MEQQFSNNRLFLLPARFKKLGYGIVLLALLALAINKIIDSSLVLAGSGDEPQKPAMFTTLFSILLIIGLSCIAWTREKIEDELVLSQRLRSMGVAFIGAVLYVIVTPLIALLGGYAIKTFYSTELVVGMLIAYLITFFILKRSVL